MDFLLAELAEIFKALAHPTRLKVIYYLKDRERCVCEFIEEFSLEQSNISQHLAVLKRAGIVSSRRVGLNVHYRLTNPKFVELVDLLKDIVIEETKKESENLLKGEDFNA
ncbi:ArsR/SmtB family transcription factor [Carboxydothermus hydrogenoformans]|uniref:Transcriptional regulator, ArsR family n=1 Tax=Carboxydothermus hydrogenoformans (strain ATCC BAA-161 / DSM 6008 / Z-2901) TaxID=246194 RepID=Q3AD40_CARHZ|nr:metalloregulator ArsR/SmtB family transcription factor [Carboxydothermus hydrogenoformans]ABB13734.1 transcriptional regulator, ArsR family [Carboxydothermus hydrogenoformans Z-2901]